MRKNKGFTLIELLAVIVILGVIMIIAIPSVTSYITNARKDSYISDAKMFVNAAKTMLTADATLPQEAGSKVVVPISDIPLDKGGEKSPYGNDWDYANSFVVVENQGTSSDPNYVWQVALNDIKGNCIPLTAMNELRRENVGTNCEKGEGVIPTPTPSPAVNTLIAKLTNATIDTSINFNEIPTETNGSGLFIRSGTENNTNPIYYYRGIVSNNNVRFAGFCWKIVRTTETGGIKLIYNGVPADDGSCNNTGTASQLASTSKFNTSYNDNAYVGYMYGSTGASTYDATHANTNNSTIKTAIDAWYASNMTAYTSKLEDAVWCNDRSLSTTGNSGTGAGKSVTYYGAYGRVLNSNPQPSLSCINTNDRFTVSSSNGNGALTYPVGLLTADEATLAGSGYYGYSSSSYLYTGQNWWLGSPGSFNGRYAYEFRVNSSGVLNYLDVHYSVGVRPAVSLKPGTVVTGDGDGSVQTPYEIG